MVNSQHTADRECTRLTSTVLALCDEVLILFVFPDNQWNRVGLNAGRFLKAKLLDDVALDIRGNSELLVIPRLALINERTGNVAGVFVLDQLHFLNALIFVFLYWVV